MNFLLEAFRNANKGDEFFTRYSDIEKELSNYNLFGLIVYCNSDSPNSSNFVKYFKDNFKKIGLKKLMATFNDQQPFLYVYDGFTERRIPIQSGKLQDNYKFINKSDIVITNPPFSNGILQDLLNYLLGIRKKFIMVGPLALGLRGQILMYVKGQALYVGHTNINTFTSPTGENINSPTCWWTNIPIKKEPIPLTAKYDEKLYPKYDNCDAINCDKVKMIPSDYDGKIGVPVSFLMRYNKEQFSIVGLLSHPIINGTKIMSRILIKRK